MVFVQTCNKCFGRMQAKQCTTCTATGIMDAEASVTVNIPGGVADHNILRVPGMGHFAGFLFGQLEQHTDVHLHVRVTPEPGLRLDGINVVSDLEISLLDALRGCKKTVNNLNLGTKMRWSSRI
jgi:molecular chaperone DnaJ